MSYLLNPYYMQCLEGHKIVQYIDPLEFTNVVENLNIYICKILTFITLCFLLMQLT